MIAFKMAVESDQPRLEQFIKDHWSSTHVFVEHPQVFRWQHLAGPSSGGVGNQRFNMLYAESGEDLVGVLGFIPMGRFSADLGDRDVMLAIWKVIDDAPPGAGLGLLKALQAKLSPRLIAAIGTSDMVRPIYKALRYEVGVLDHWVRFNPDRRGATRVASGVPDGVFEGGDGDRSVQLVPASELNDVAALVDRLGNDQLPQKDWTYVRERFTNHPWFNYDVRVAVADAQPVGLIVWRRVETHDTSVLRIVDVVGSPAWIGRAGSAFGEAVAEADAEYVDLVAHGIPADQLQDAGFTKVDLHEGLVVPNYFSPFESRNVGIEFAFRRFSSDLPVRLFRADSDQDRPNRSIDLRGRADSSGAL